MGGSAFAFDFGVSYKREFEEEAENSKKRASTALILMCLIVAVVAVSVTLLIQRTAPSGSQPIGTPPSLFSENIIVLNEGVSSINGLNSAFANISQGTNLQFNVSFTSRSAKPIALSIESLKMTYYNSSVDSKSWIVSDPNQYTTLQESTLNYSFSPNPVTLQQFMSNSTLLTMSLSQDAPAGQYTFEINTGNIGVTQPDGTTTLSYSSSFGIMIIVVPKTNG